MEFLTRKMINDPVHGFITINDPLIFAIFNHPFFQRLRRIQQMALAQLVYPGAVHTRLHHSLGAYQLMCIAINELRDKGIEISAAEAQAAKAAILMHDIGHGPYSHGLENVLLKGVHHEALSLLIMNQLNADPNPALNGQLTMAIQIFTNQYPKTFLHQLISGQLDVDRLDYLSRDSFFTGVSEGVVGYERILKMLNVKDNILLVEEKGVNSVEKFLVSRRLMYWQVYLHKTVVAAEYMLIYTLRRAKELVKNGEVIFASSALKFFLENDIKQEDFEKNPKVLDFFAQLDDYDILGAIKEWQNNSDEVLSILSKALVNRKLFKIEISKEPFSKARIENEKKTVQSLYNLTPEALDYFVYSDILTNKAYNQDKENINILMKTGEIIDLTKASDNLNISALAQPVEKYFLCYPVA